MFGLAELAIIVFIVAMNVAMICAIVSAAGFDSSTWARVGREKTLWIVAMLVAGLVAVPIYLLFVRPKLHHAQLDESQI